MPADQREPPASLAALLRERGEEVLQEWERLHQERLPDKRLTREERRNNLPELLEELGDAADKATPERDVQLERHMAANHARQRLELGFSLEEVNLEYSLLRKVLLHALGEEEERLGPHGLIALHEALDLAVSLAVTTYAHESQARLESQQRLLDAVLQQLPAGVVITEPDGRLVLTNQRMERLLGRSFPRGLPAEEYLPNYRGLHPDGRPYAYAEWPLARSLAQGEVVRGEEVELVREDGTHLFLRLSSTPVHDAQGRLMAGVVIGEDITERKRVEAERDRRERAQALLAEAGMALGSSLDYEGTLAAVARLAVPKLADWCLVDVVDEAGRMQRVAVAHADPAQAPLAEVLRRHPLSHLPGHPAAQALEENRPLLLSRLTEELGRASTQSAEHLRAVIAIRPRSLLAVPLVARGERLGALTFLSTRKGRRYDEADLALAEELGRRAALAVDNARLYRQAQESRAFFHAMLQGATFGIISSRPDGTIRFFNAAAERMLGWRAEEVVDRETPALFHDAEETAARAEALSRELGHPVAPGFEAFVARARLGQPEAREWTYVRRDGSRFPVHLVVTAVHSESGELLGFMGLAEDVTERKRLEAESRARSEFEQQLIGIVSHDLRNPLNAIRLGAQAVLRRDELETRQTVALTRIVSSAERATRMIRDLLDFTQARLGGGIPVQPAPLELHALTRQVVEEVRLSYPEREVRLEQEGEGAGQWDSDRLAQLLTNLLTNAFKYSPEDTPVTVRTRGEGEQVRLEVHNLGPLIPPEVQACIFEPLQRASGESDKQERSLGLGLYIVRHIVQAHGGTVTVRSTAEEGTTFTVLLPRRPQAA